MRVFCPVHKRGFFTPRQSPIKCGNRGHILGELDFAGEGKPAVELQWQYCCNCEHFCPTDLDQNSLERCPVCTRRSSVLYLCNRCYTISFESNTPLQTKNFTLTSDGAPQPSCPGCLQKTSTDLRDHICPELSTSFMTALNSCPICRERLDIGPSFPSSIANYLRRTKAANKLNVTFDYDTELFVPVDDGEFVLISNSSEATQLIVLPRVARFAAKQDFYELYQDYYHCNAPDAGEVHIIQPASVDRIGDGWRLQSIGIIEVVDDQQKKKAPINVTLKQTETSISEKPALPIAALKEESPIAPCTHCGSLVETRYAFCWRCGKPLESEEEIATKRPEAATPSGGFLIDDEVPTLQHHVQPGPSALFSWALPNESAPATAANGSLLKLIAVAVVCLVLVPLGLFVVTHSASSLTGSTAPQTTPSTLQSASSAAAVVVKRGSTTEPKSQGTPVAHPDDEELVKLRNSRIAATPSDRQTLLQTFVRTEKQHPNDYRFPYERAKLAIVAARTRSHDEAFSALSLAAEKAIKTGKAQEMLEGLEADKAGDFHKLSHGHHEWIQLLEALKSKDTSVLSAKL